MTQKDKELLLLEDICGRLPYGVKVLCEGWDSDHGCEFNTVEDLIGIDDRFIYTLWRGERDKHSIVEPLSITDYKPYLRPLSSMTEEEYQEFNNIRTEHALKCLELSDKESFELGMRLQQEEMLYLYQRHYDVCGLIPKDLAIEAPEGMYSS